MRWFYARCGKIHEHGLVDEKTLVKMARTGELAPDDLVWSEFEGDGWVRASRVEGLFPADEPASDPVVADAPDEKTGPPKKEAAPAHTLPIGTVLFVLFLAGLAILIWQVLVRYNVRQPDVGTPPTDAREVPEAGPEIPASVEAVMEPPVDGDRKTIDWRAVIEEIRISIDSSDAEKASALLTESLGAIGTNSVLSDLSRQLVVLKESLDRFAALTRALAADGLDRRQEAELVRLSQRHRRGDELKSLLYGMAQTPKKLTAAKCVSLVRIGNTTDDKELVRLAGGHYAALMPETTSYETAYDVLGPVKTAGFAQETRQLVARLLEIDSKCGPAWLELAALQCADGLQKEALESLKNATRFGGDDVRQSAKADGRFKPISDTWQFRRYTKTKD